MIIFIAELDIDKKELKRLEKYMNDCGSGIVIVVRDTDNIKITEKE